MSFILSGCLFILWQHFSPKSVYRWDTNKKDSSLRIISYRRDLKSDPLKTEIIQVLNGVYFLKTAQNFRFSNGWLPFWIYHSATGCFCLVWNFKSKRAAILICSASGFCMAFKNKTIPYMYINRASAICVTVRSCHHQSIY